LATARVRRLQNSLARGATFPHKEEPTEAQSKCGLEDNISDFNILFDLELNAGLDLLRGQHQQENWIMPLIEVHSSRTFQSRGKPSSRMTSAMISNMRGEIWVLISVVASDE